MISTKKITLAAWMLVLSGLFMFSACSTKKNTLVRRTYHNITAHYNVYWNGMDNIRQGLKEYRSGLKDNYALVLPVFYYGDKAGAGKMSQYSDIAIKKAAKAINKHSMVFNRKEYVRWIDDSYMLIGKSYFYKQDYPMARRTFEFVIKTYNYNEIKYDAMLWQAKANIEEGDFAKAEPMLDMLQSKINKGDAPQRLETELNLVYSQFFILQKNFEGAIPYLNRALELKPSAVMRNRCMFILGQIHQLYGDLNEASRMYSYVIKHAKSYEMEFNAKINLAQCYDATTGNREFIVKKLTKMLKDYKNKDFQDQIYYALAHIAMKDADTVKAIEYYEKSVSTSKTNNYQKAISSLELADIFFGTRNYTISQAYYDSTMQFLPKDYPNYKELYKRTMTLTDLVKNLQVIQRQDSLQKLATMSESDRNKVIDGIISKIIEEEMKKQAEEFQRRESQNLFGQGMGVGQEQLSGGSTEGRWYFYNPTIMSNGFSAFMRKWGRRKLEDNWFLTDKTVISFDEETKPADSVAGEAGDTTKDGKKLAKSKNPKERAYYLTDIPFTKERVQVSNDMIIEAYYQAGFIFVEGLGDYGNAVETFETLLDRFPDNKYKIQTAYKLCQLYSLLQNQPKSDQFKNQILTLYPETDYARLLVNPNYYKEINARQSEASKLYNDTYKAYSNQQYYMVINNADIARTKYKSDSILMPKFDYMRAMALGKIEVVDSLVSAMKKVIRDYPASPVKPMAENVLAFLGGQSYSTGKTEPGDSTATPDNSVKLYKFDPKAMHFYVLVVNDELVDVEALKVKISDYNSKFHDLENLMVNSLLLDNGRQMITVSNFYNSETAMNYFLAILTSKYIFTKLENAGEYFNFVISIENYPILYNNKDIPKYLRFFEKNYPGLK
ncbi:MAG: tetratricopeptide repeat protein [Bacteroidales bacterium]|nr:tetratricopeptide repeat protein [Bacteroidales bacterium]